MKKIPFLALVCVLAFLANPVDAAITTYATVKTYYSSSSKITMVGERISGTYTFPCNRKSWGVTSLYYDVEPCGRL